MRSISMVADPITLNRNSSADAFGSKPSEHASAEANASNSKNSKKDSNSNNPASEPPLTVVNPSSKGENGNNSRKKLNFFQRWWRSKRSDDAKEKVNEKETETEEKAKKEAAELEEKLRKDMEMKSSKSTHESVESDSDDKFHAWIEKCSDPSLILAFVMFRSQQKSLSKSEEDYKQWEISQKVNEKMVSEQKEAADKAAELGRKLETPGSVAGVVKIVCYGGAAVALVAAIIAAVPAVPLIASAGAAAAIQSAGTTVGIYTTISTLATNAGQTLPPIINSGTKKEMDLNQAKVKEFDGRISSWSQKISMCAQRMSNELQISNHLMNMIQSILQSRKDTLSALSR